MSVLYCHLWGGTGMQDKSIVILLSIFASNEMYEK